ncbi:MAG: Crp/Fnr family transcriptional regulator [Prolixibacteraceae bacterium]|nr:Crp/Fnr family transcriptional regulator [Prolixibacteraceae bacterium]
METFKKFLSDITPLNQDEWTYVKSLFFEEEIKKGQYILRPGEICSKVSFIPKGLFRMFYLVKGEENTTLFFSENQLVTDYYSFLTKTPCIGTIQALENSKLYSISYSNLQLLYDFKSWERIGRIMAERAFSFSVMEANRFIHDDFETRYVTFLKENPDYIQRIPQYMIASYLKMTPETLSRIKKRISKKTNTDYISIVDTPKSKFL